MNEASSENFSTETTAQYEPVVEFEKAAVEQPKERWYQKAGKSVGARIGICASALLVVALASGMSAYAGASLASKDADPKTTHMEQALNGKDMQGFGTDSFKGMDSQRDRSFGTTPDSGMPNGDAPGSGNFGGKSLDTQKPQKGDAQSDLNGDDTFSLQGDNGTNGRSTDSGSAKKGAIEGDDAA